MLVSSVCIHVFSHKQVKSHIRPARVVYMNPGRQRINIYKQEIIYEGGLQFRWRQALPVFPSRRMSSIASRIRRGFVTNGGGEVEPGPLPLGGCCWVGGGG